jgi:nucleoid DNA-binding protein
METYNKNFLIHEIAARANFTVGDVRVIIDTMIEVIKDVLAENSELFLSGLFHLSVGEIEAHEGVNPRKNERIQIPTAKRIRFRASKSLYSLIKEN